MPKSGATTASAVLMRAGRRHRAGQAAGGPFGYRQPRQPVRAMSSSRASRLSTGKVARPGRERFGERVDQVGRRELFHHRAAEVHGGAAARSPLDTEGSRRARIQAGPQSGPVRLAEGRRSRPQRALKAASGVAVGRTSRFELPECLVDDEHSSPTAAAARTSRRRCGIGHQPPRSDCGSPGPRRPSRAAAAVQRRPVLGRLRARAAAGQALRTGRAAWAAAVATGTSRQPAGAGWRRSRSGSSDAFRQDLVRPAGHGCAARRSAQSCAPDVSQNLLRRGGLRREAAVVPRRWPPAAASTPSAS